MRDPPVVYPQEVHVVAYLASPAAQGAAVEAGGDQHHPAVVVDASDAWSTPYPEDPVQEFRLHPA